MRALLSVAAVLLCACSSSMQSGDPATDVRLVAAPTTVATGGDVTLTLENDAAEQIGYNLCTSSLERQTGDSWVVVQTDIVCTLELRTLDPGGRGEYRSALPTGLPPGRYRYTTSIEAMQTGARHAVSSNAFTVSS